MNDYDSSAPWNEIEKEEREFTIMVSCLMEKEITVKTACYTYEDGEPICALTDDELSEICMKDKGEWKQSDNLTFEQI